MPIKFFFWTITLVQLLLFIYIHKYNGISYLLLNLTLYEILSVHDTVSCSEDVFIDSMMCQAVVGFKYFDSISYVPKYVLIIYLSLYYFICTFRISCNTDLSTGLEAQ